ncbi:MAG: hypothetical protein AAGA85_10860 [Bacteroidota bacterium]
MKWSLEYMEISFSGHKELTDGTDTTEVIITTIDGEIYSAPFFSYHHVMEVIKEAEHKGSLNDDYVFLQGGYMWKKNMILIEHCREQEIREVIKDLLDAGNFLEVFRKL